MYKRILFPTDGSEFAHRALDHVKYVAALGHADVAVLQVVTAEPETATGPLSERHAAAELDVREISEELKFEDIGDVEGIVRTGDPAHTIVQEAGQQHADVIIMATHGRSGLRRMVLGSVADYVARHAECPVLLVPPEG